MLDLLKKIIALVPAGHELYETIAKLFQELCSRVTAAEDSVRDTQGMLLARADQVGELTTRLAQLESSERIPQLAKEIKDVRLDTIEDQLTRMVARLDQAERDPNVRFVRAELAPPAAAAGDSPPEIVASDIPPATRVQCAFHPYAPMIGDKCQFPDCSWPGIDSAA